MNANRLAARVWPYSLILFVSLLFRIPNSLDMSSSVLVRFPVVDASLHHKDALRMLSGQTSQQPYFKPPLYPGFLATCYRFLGPDPGKIPWVQGVLGSLTCLMVAGLASHLFGRRCGLVTGLLASLYEPFLLFEGQLLAPPLTLGFLALSCLLFLRSPALCGVSGLCWGLALLTRPELLVCVPLSAAWMFRRNRRQSAFYVIGAFLPILFTTVRNQLVSGELVFLSSNSGINLYTAWRPEADGISPIEPGFEWEKVMRFPKSLGIEKDSEISAYWTGRALSSIREDPARSAVLLLKKTLVFWNRHEIRNNIGPEILETFSRVLRLPLPGFGFLFPLAVAGLYSCLTETAKAREDRKGWPDWTLLPLLTGGVLLSTLPFFVCDRFRLSSVPFLMPLAGWGLMRVTAGIRGHRRLVSVMMILAGSACLSWPDPWGVSRGKPPRDLWLLGVSHLQGNQVEQARQCFERGLSLSGQDPDLWAGLGNAFFSMKEYGPAISAFQKALSLAPDYSIAQGNLAATLCETGEFLGAVAWAGKARSLDPAMDKAYLVEAKALRAMGRTEEALLVLDACVSRCDGSEAAQALKRELQGL